MHRQHAPQTPPARRHTMVRLEKGFVTGPSCETSARAPLSARLRCTSVRAPLAVQIYILLNARGRPAAAMRPSGERMSAQIETTPRANHLPTVVPTASLISSW